MTAVPAGPAGDDYWHHRHVGDPDANPPVSHSTLLDLGADDHPMYQDENESAAIAAFEATEAVADHAAVVDAHHVAFVQSDHDALANPHHAAFTSTDHANLANPHHVAFVQSDHDALANPHHVAFVQDDHDALPNAHHSNALDHASTNDPTAGQKAALAGTNGAPGVGNEYVSTSDVRMTDARTPVNHAHIDGDLPASIARDAEVTTAVSNHSGAADPHTGYVQEAAVPGGELGGTYASPTVDPTHSGSSHAGVEAAAADALATHVAASDSHTGYQKESEKAQANGYASLGAGALVPIAQLASGTPDGTKFVRDDGTLVTPTAAIPEMVQLDRTPADDITITGGNSAMIFRHYTIADGKTLTLGDGADFVIL